MSTLTPTTPTAPVIDELAKTQLVVELLQGNLNQLLNTIVLLRAENVELRKASSTQKT